MKPSCAAEAKPRQTELTPRAEVASAASRGSIQATVPSSSARLSSLKSPKQMVTATSRRTLQFSTLHDNETRPLLGLNFGNVLGNALCVERGLARRLSRVA